MLIALIVVLLLFGIPGGWYSYGHYGAPGGIGVGFLVVLLLVIILARRGDL